MLGKNLWSPPDADVAAAFYQYSAEKPIDHYIEIDRYIESLTTEKRLTPYSGKRLSDYIKKHIDERTPSSFTRMSDGEGNLVAIAYDVGVPATLRDYCLRKISYIHFGDYGIICQNEKFFGDFIKEAVEYSDVIGFPKLASIKNHFSIDDESKDVRAIVGNRASFSLLGQIAESISAFSDAWFSRGLLPSYKGLVEGAERIGLISVYPELADKLKIAFEVGAVDFVQVPTQAVFVAPKSRKNTGHFPDGMNRILGEIDPKFKGQVFFVAAGLLGKLYCTEIKKRGGIAIDIGSIAEVWLGIQARGIPADFIEKWKLRPT